MIRHNGRIANSGTAAPSPHGYEGVPCGARPELFFPPARRGRESVTAEQDREAAAKRICGGCPSGAQCLRDALAAEAGKPLHERAGVFAGLTAAERYTIQTGIPVPPRSARPPAAPRPSRRRLHGPGRSLADFTAEEIAIFRAKIRQGDHGPEWALSLRGGHGYGQFRAHRDAPRIAAQRLAYMLAGLGDPGWDDVLQSCGNHACLNPGCLYTRPRLDGRGAKAEEAAAA